MALVEPPFRAMGRHILANGRHVATAVDNATAKDLVRRLSDSNDFVAIPRLR